MKIHCFRWTFALLVALGGTTVLRAASTIQFSASTYAVAEGTPEVSILVQRTDDLDTVVGVDFATTNLTATADADYTDVSTTLTFLAGETNKLVTVPILNDGLVEGVKTFQATLSNPTGGAVLGVRLNATVRITDNDKGLAFEFGSYSVAEDAGSVLIGVTRGDDGNLPVTVDFATSDLTATNGLNYAGTNGTLTFAPGQKVALFTVPILNNGVREANKAFRSTLSNPTNQVLAAQRTTTVTIVENDRGVQFQPFNKYWIGENESAVTLTVVRGNDVNLGPVTVDFATSDVTATNGLNYIGTNGTLSFAQGERVQTLTVPLLYREVAEADRQFKMMLSNPTGGAVLGPNTTATVTILDATGMTLHRFSGISLLPDQRVQLSLDGGVHKRFKDYFDLYPIEVSTNLVDWAPLVTLQRTNSTTNILAYTDPTAATSDQRFYRTVSKNLITPLRQPTGPLPVGVISRLVSDPSRRNRYNVSTNGSFMVSVWYPAVAEAGKLPDPMEDERLAQDPDWLTLWVGNGSLIDRELSFVSWALPDAKCALGQAPYPIVLYSPGAQGARTEIVERGPELASHGYVVVAADPADAYATVFPDGTCLKNITTLTDADFQDRRVRDLRFLLDELEEWNESDQILAGRLDLANVATMGWSAGGGVAVEVARIDERFKAAIVLEAYFTSTTNFKLLKPSLSIYADPITLPGLELPLFNAATHDAIWFQISSTVHLNFFDYYWGVTAPASGREAARTMNAYCLRFLNNYLKGRTDPMPSLKHYPRVINLKQK